MTLSPEPSAESEARNPESKLELIDGRLIVGNTLRGSRYMLWDILSSYSTPSALCMADERLWWEALREAFQDWDPPTVPSSDTDADIDTWRRWASQVDYEPVIEPGGPRFSWEHHDICQSLRTGLYHLTIKNSFAFTIGRDFVLRLGENAFTPDLFLILFEERERLYHRYYQGAPCLVIEVLLAGHEEQDTDVKRRHYAEAGVPEYWIVDPLRQQIDFLHLDGNGYTGVPLRDDGRYLPAGIPGLALTLDKVWLNDFHDPPFVFLDAGPDDDTPRHASPRENYPPRPGGIRWDSVAFSPRVGLDSLPIRFDEFISWCPRAKFERFDGRVVVGGATSYTRLVLGLLLATFGLRETVRLLPPGDWVEGLAQWREARRQDPERKRTWFGKARRAAEILREHHAIERVAVVGDLASSDPLNPWSKIEIMTWGLKKKVWDAWEMLEKQLGEDPAFELTDADDLIPEVLERYEDNAVDL